MPRLSGLDLVQRLRRNGATTPVLMLTARDAPADRITGLDAGADDYLVKPFDFGELLARMRALQRRPPVGQIPWIKKIGRASCRERVKVLEKDVSINK